jgi:RimJ/RimL family protein N-acetyltransferase
VVIYDGEERGRGGLGSAVRRLVLSRVFDEMNFRYVYGRYLESNTASQRMNAKMGARVMGTRRAVGYTDGRCRDVVCRAFSREQFTSGG